MPTINFVNEKKELQVPAGANLRKEALTAGVNLYYGFNGIGQSLNQVMNCHGLGACGTCRVLVTKGMENTNPMTLMEKVKFKTMLPTPLPDPLPCLAFIGHEDTMRLACCVEVKGDITVQTNPELNVYGENFFS